MLPSASTLDVLDSFTDSLNRTRRHQPLSIPDWRYVSVLEGRKARAEGDLRGLGGAFPERPARH